MAPPNAFVLIWRWRWELAIFVAIPAGLSALMIKFGWAWGLAFLGMAVVISAWPLARNWLIAHMRCIVTAHRVRTGCAQAWIQTRSGKLPVILRTTPQPRGERVYIWCRAGICLEDFQAAHDILRSACWASDIHVTSSTRYSHIVILEVERYPASPLSLEVRQPNPDHPLAPRLCRNRWIQISRRPHSAIESHASQRQHPAVARINEEDRVVLTDEADKLLIRVITIRQRMAGLAVPAAVEPVPPGLTRLRGDRGVGA